ncbi:hypothetical protein DCCM_0630 [Desulfocucumis palustris]|uniref:Endonuclease III n=1 Tax=Desulfocucumis palustris TaxID=1898651 RepID=A0A2L2X933_9FIRM|nr:hypothetical protein [Desulfocucumis palustris]GBF32434.1 hypothetical protein DCCM_0630 [Desulfocucumis palustris]
MTKKNLLSQCRENLLLQNPAARESIRNMVNGSYKKMGNRRILQNISWTVLLTGYQLQSAKKIWPEIKKAMLWFSPALNQFFPGWCKSRLPGVCDNPKKVRAFLNNLEKTRELIIKHGSLAAWLDLSENLAEQLVANYSFIGNNNVKKLLDSLGFRNLHLHQADMEKTLFRLGLLGKNRPSKAFFGALTALSREEGCEIIEAYAILYLFSQTVCGLNPLCSSCIVEGCPEKNP